MNWAFRTETLSREAYNERIKLISQVLQNLGTALTIAGAGVWWTVGFANYLAIWSVVAISLFMTSYAVLAYLESEPE